MGARPTNYVLFRTVMSLFMKYFEPLIGNRTPVKNQALPITSAHMWVIWHSRDAPWLRATAPFGPIALGPFGPDVVPHNEVAAGADSDLMQEAVGPPPSTTGSTGRTLQKAKEDHKNKTEVLANAIGRLGQPYSLAMLAAG